MSAATIVRNPTAPVVPFGVAKNSFAVWPVAAENVCVPVAEMVVGEAASHEGSAHVILPIPDPVPLNVQVVPVHPTPAPVKVKAPVVELILLTPPALELAKTKASVAIFVVLSPTVCVVAVVPFGRAGVPDRFAAVPVVFWLSVGKLVRLAALNVGEV
jgi:hypothetical protein